LMPLTSMEVMVSSSINFVPRLIIDEMIDLGDPRNVARRLRAKSLE